MRAIHIENLVKVYPNGFKAVDDLSLDVEQGEFFGFLGPNGAGKTTTVQILSHLIPKTGGSVSICGFDLDTDPMHAKQMIGVVPQEFNFAYFESLENILVKQASYYNVPRSVAKVRAKSLLERLGLGSKRKEAAFRLSGGMKRRLMVARALVHEPKILILDEPTAGVDVEMRRSLWEFLLELKAKGTTIILTTHYLEEAEYLCDRVGLIQKGSLIGTYSIKALSDELDSESYVLTCQSKVETGGQYGAKWLSENELLVEVGREERLNTLFSWADRQGLVVLSMRQEMGRLEALFTRLTAQASN